MVLCFFLCPRHFFLYFLNLIYFLRTDSTAIFFPKTSGQTVPCSLALYVFIIYHYFPHRLTLYLTHHQCSITMYRMKVKAIQPCPNICSTMDYTVRGILQARMLEWVAFPFSRGTSQPRDQTQVPHIAGRFFTS